MGVQSDTDVKHMSRSYDQQPPNIEHVLSALRTLTADKYEPPLASLLASSDMHRTTTTQSSGLFNMSCVRTLTY